MRASLLRQYRRQIDAIRPPDELDCRNLLTGRTMHFIAESGVQLTREQIFQLTQEAIAEEQRLEARNDRRERRGSRRAFRA